LKPALGLRFGNRRDGKDKQFIGISIRKAARELLQPTSKIRGHHDVLLAGLRAWVLRPTAPRYAANQMRIAAAEQIARIEEKLIRRKHTYLTLGVLRYDSRYHELFETLHYPMGGTRGLIRAYETRQANKEASQRVAREIAYLVAVIGKIHQAAKESYRNGRALLSPTSANKLLVEKTKNNVGQQSATSKPDTPYQLGDDQFRKYWKHHARSLALVYAASLLPWPTHTDSSTPGQASKTLLDALIASRISFSKISPILSRWFAYAEFVRQSLLEPSKIRKPRTKTASKRSVYVQFDFVTPIDPALDRPDPHCTSQPVAD
jgi:hypothetical protein